MNSWYGIIRGNKNASQCLQSFFKNDMPTSMDILESVTMLTNFHKMEILAVFWNKSNKSVDTNPQYWVSERAPGIYTWP